MKKNLKIFILCLGSVLLFFSLHAEPVGYLVVHTGMIKLRSNLIDHIVKAGMDEVAVNATDEIQTGKSTRVRVFLNEKNETIELFSNTFFKVSSVTDEKSELYMPIGKIRCQVNPSFSKINKVKRGFSVRTVTAIVSVKGSGMMIQASGLVTNLLTLSGIIGFASIDQPELEVNVTQNQASKTVKGAAPTPPVEVPQDVVDEISTQETDETWEGVEFGDIPSAEDLEEEEDVETLPEIEELVPEDIESARDTVSEVQTTTDTDTGTGTGTDTNDEITITIVEE
ncbi:hypothetical protein KJ966_31485 [bacterium]|nr:hypothetical protein [bacterium]